MSLHRAPILPGLHTAGDTGRTGSSIIRRSWLRSLPGANKKNTSVSYAVFRVLINLAFLLGFVLLLRNRSQHYFRQRHYYSQSAAINQHSALQGVSGDTAAAELDRRWLPPAWVGTPPPVDPLACTPQLLVIGGMKCGTSALFHYLNGTVPRPPKAAKHVQAEWRPPKFGDDQQFLNGTPASADYCNKFFSLPDEQRRFHPGIIGSIVTKEVHFFDQDPQYVHSHLNQYLAKFPGVDMAADDPMSGKCSYPAKIGLNSSSPPAMVRMEATVMYMPTRSSAGLVKELLPQTRLVALLREPVTRALSSINMVIQRGDFWELKGLAKNAPEYSKVWRQVVVRELRKEMQLVKDCFDQADQVSAGAAAGGQTASSNGNSNSSWIQQIDACVLGNKSKLSERILDIHLGLYALHLQRWFSYFPPQQLLIWSTKAFKENPWHHMEQLVRWLGLDPALCKKRGDFLKMHKRTYPDGSLPRGFLQEVAAFYEPHNQQLFALLEAQGYVEVVAQLKQAWPLELASTIDKLEEKSGQVAAVA